LDDIFPVIALLEGRCAFDATQRATPADVQALAAWHQRLEQHAEAGRINDYYDANFAIHEAIIQLANNKWLAQTIADLRKILKLARLQQLHAPGRLKQSLKEHMAVFAALQAGDAAGADAAMRDHLLQQREALRELASTQRSVLTA
jgi:DNA-binding GntR family transcriptional regulator